MENTLATNQIFCVYLETANGLPRVVFCRLDSGSANGPQSTQNTQKVDQETAYYFSDDDLNGWVAISADEAQRGGDSRPRWVRVDTAPDSLVDFLKSQIHEDRLEKWQGDNNAYGLLDESAFKDRLVPDKKCACEVEGNSVCLSDEAWATFQAGGTAPSFLVMESRVIEIYRIKLWNVRTLHRLRYAATKQQSLTTTTLRLIDSDFKGKPFFLICNSMIVEQCAKHAVVLTQEIIKVMRGCEESLVCDKARQKIADNLHRFTYGGKFSFRSFKDLCALGWLEPLMGAFDSQYRNEFYKTVLDHSPDEDIRKWCGILASATAGKDNDASYKQLIEASEQAVSTAEMKEQFLLLFEFLGRDYLVGLPPGDLPSGDCDIPELDVSKLNPVLVRTDIGQGRYLGMFYKRLATVRVRLRQQGAGNAGGLRVADFVADATEKDITDYDNGLLIDVLRARTPFHERRLLQMIGIPCRQALGDIFYDRAAAGLHPLSRPEGKPTVDGRTFQTRDEVVVEMAKKYVTLNRQLQDFRLDELTRFVENQEVEKTRPLLEKLSIVRKIASFDEHLAETPLASLLDVYAAQFEDQGHILAQRLCKTVLGCAGNVDNNLPRNECKEWVAAFWREIQECFPDGPSWESFRKCAYERAPGAPEDKPVTTAYTLFVLASVFDRQITTFYVPEGQFVMPYDAMVWAVSSVHRLQMMSALLGVCCGDWVCQHRVDNVLSRRMVWNHRIASMTKVWRVAEDTAGVVPAPRTEETSFCNNHRCRHAPQDAAMFAVGTALYFDKIKLNSILQKMGWWFNGLLDEEMHHHFRCKCGSIMAPTFNNEKLNFFKCPKWNNADHDHDNDVYLNWCVHSHCSNVIDSREKVQSCSNNFRICTKCGSCCFKHQETQEYGDNVVEEEIWVPACRSCSRKLNDAWEAIKQGLIKDDSGEQFVCDACGDKNIVYPSRAAWWSQRESENARMAAIQWGMLDQYFKYNSRPV